MNMKYTSASILSYQARHLNYIPFSRIYNCNLQPNLIDSKLINQFEDDSIQLINYIFSKLNLLNTHYPNFHSWLEDKVFPGLYYNQRKILLEWRNGNVAGIAITKDDGFEKKICCLRIQPEFQYRGLGIKLFEKAMLVLDTDKPLLSISQNHRNLNDFLKIFNYFKFEQTAIYKDLYMHGTSEISFNGILK